MASNDSYYLPDEEKFGFLTSHLYDLFSGITPMKKFHKFVVDTVLSKNPQTVLDIGFGTGDVIRQLAKSRENLMIYGVEPSPHMSKVAGRKLKKFIREGRVNIAGGSSREIPFDKKFDIVFSSLSFHHWQKQQESILNILKYLNPEGRFLVFEYGHELIEGYKKAAKSHALSMNQLENLRKTSEFEIRDSGEYRCVAFKSHSSTKA